MGTLRLALAIGVVLSHVGGSILAYAFTPGDASVQCFFVISGFLMAMIWSRQYAKAHDARLFYTNRALRIFVPYLIVLALALIVASVEYATAGRGTFAAWKAASSRLTAGDWVYLIATSVGIVGQDATLFLRMSPDGLQWTSDFHFSSPRVYQLMLVPQAWSLSLELMFYALVPLLVRRHWAVIAGVMLASLGLRCWGYVNEYDGDPWSYRFFPFELALFLAGVLAYRLMERLNGRAAGRLDAAIGAAVVALVILFARYDDRSFDFFSPPRLVLYGGLALGLPFLFRATSASRLDRAIGDLSYPVYLVHELVAQLVPAGGLSPDARALVVVALSIAASAVLVRLVEAPLDAFRHRRLAAALRG